MHKITAPDEYFDKFMSDLGLEPSIEPRWTNCGGPSNRTTMFGKERNRWGSRRTHLQGCQRCGNTSHPIGGLCSGERLRGTLRGLLRIIDGLLEKIRQYQNLQ